MTQMVQIRVSEATHKRLKLAAAITGGSLQETADTLLRESAENVIAHAGQPLPERKPGNGKEAGKK